MLNSEKKMPAYLFRYLLGGVLYVLFITPLWALLLLSLVNESVMIYSSGLR